MKVKKLLLLFTALLLALGLMACAASQEEADGEPDLSEMYCPPEDGSTLIDDGDVPLGSAPGENKEQPSYIQQVIDLVNQERAAQGVGELTAMPEIETAAAVRAEELVTSFSHTRPNGTKYRTALEDNGVKAGYSGENAAMGYRTPADVVKGWMKSEGHRKNILKAEYTHAGAGYYVDSSTGYAYWCLLLTSDPS